MNGHWRVLSFICDLTGLSELYHATSAANYWLSFSVMARALAALFMVATTLAFSVRVVRLSFPRITLPLRWSAICGVGMWLSTMGFHVLRTLTAFNLPVALACLAALAAATIWALPERAPWRWSLEREWRGIRRVARLFTKTRYWFVSALFFAYVLLFATRSLIVPPLGWDTLTYHGPRAVHWLQTNQFTYDPGPGPYSFYRHFISGGEVLMVWALLPFHSDLLANLTSIVPWLGIGAASWGLARSLGVRDPFASCSAGLVMMLPVLSLEMNTGYVEPALNLALLNGIALAVACMRKPNAVLAMAAAMSLGVAAGIKLPGAPPGVIVLAALLVRFLFVRAIDLRIRFAVLAASSLLAALPLLPWAYEAWAETGYPLSPMPVKIFGLQLGVSSPAMQWYQDRPALQPYTWAFESHAFKQLFLGVNPFDAGFGPPLGVTSLVPLSVALVALAGLAFRLPLLAGVLCAAMAAPWFTHFSAGLSVPRLYWAISVARYLIVLMALAIPVSFTWCKRTSLLAQTYRRLLLTMSLWLAAMSLLHGFAPWEMSELMIMGVLLLGLGTLIWWLLQRGVAWPWWRHAAIFSVLFMFACSGLQLRRDQTRERAYRSSFALHNVLRYWVDGVAKVDEPDVSHRIAVTGGPLQNADQWFYYFFLGARFQNTVEYVPPTLDGGVAHFGPYGDFARRANREAWLERIKSRKVTDVLTFPPRSSEQAWMEGLPQKFKKLSGNNDWGVFKTLD